MRAGDLSEKLSCLSAVDASAREQWYVVYLVSARRPLQPSQTAAVCEILRFSSVAAALTPPI